jgi:hypothetical protein
MYARHAGDQDRLNVCRIQASKHLGFLNEDFNALAPENTIPIISDSLIGRLLALDGICDCGEGIYVCAMGDVVVLYFQFK